MSSTDVIDGVIKADGTLELGRPVTLPPGPVRVILESTTSMQESTGAKASVWSVLQQIWQQREKLGLPGRSREEIDAQIRMLRDEWDRQ